MGATSLFAVGTIIFVHFQQKAEKMVSCIKLLVIFNIEHNYIDIRWQAMHEGVVRDMEQQRIKRERQLDFDMQRVLEEEYKREQTVRSSLEHPKS